MYINLNEKLHFIYVALRVTRYTPSARYVCIEIVRPHGDYCTLWLKNAD